LGSRGLMGDMAFIVKFTGRVYFAKASLTLGGNNFYLLTFPINK